MGGGWGLGWVFFVRIWVWGWVWRVGDGGGNLGEGVWRGGGCFMGDGRWEIGVEGCVGGGEGGEKLWRDLEVLGLGSEGRKVDGWGKVIGFGDDCLEWN